MQEIYINSTRTAALHEAISDAITAGQFGTLADDIRDCFSEDQIEQIEELLDSSDFDELIDTLLTDWSGDTPEELIEELTDILGESSIELIMEDEQLAEEDVFEDEEDDDFLDDDDDSEESFEEEEEEF